MRKSRRRWQYVAVLVLGATVIPSSGCSNDVMTLAYYAFSTVSSVLEASLTGTTSATTTSSDTSTTSTT